MWIRAEDGALINLTHAIRLRVIEPQIGPPRGGPSFIHVDLMNGHSTAIRHYPDREMAQKKLAELWVLMERADRDGIEVLPAYNNW